ncbi:hypothetical protein HO173_003860 [Letharia columbiana]|uniref:HIT domain-containing protein n=1 Tax=Letharia columbiana TaxID=112416 RepID=A0A8H6FZG3_9LECA|nr:uncharacterized protein HO173_003860 [Letharia columbiana]KAF6237659.1 hypothetical protein HO173_003860 [Letharia columbiana]
MSLATVGAVVLVLCIVAYAMSHATDSDVDLHDPEIFQERKNLYRNKRDDFRRNFRAMEELREWKAKNDDYDYVELSSGMIPPNLVGKATGSKPFAKSDTWFSEFESHNPSSLILSESQDSYIIGNLASYDKRQYPEFKPGENTPEGQGFGHCLVIPRKRIFNVVDPDATANHSAMLKEMKEHFITFWKTEDGSPKLLRRVRSTFDEQNTKLASNDRNAESCESLRSTLIKDFDMLSNSFLRCNPDDFEFAFHAYPANSVGHLHMHVFPKNSDLRKFSTKSHDWKTIPIEAVLEVEEEDSRALVEWGSG